jgi:hypothetical protein
MSLDAIEAWIDKIRLPYMNDDREVSELVISVYLTRSSVERCFHLVAKWMKGDLNVDNIVFETEEAVVESKFRHLFNPRT